MGQFFEPSLNFWAGNGTDILLEGDLIPISALNKSSLLLLVHGYNNKMPSASSAYKMFEKLQNSISPLTANVLGLYWPGSSWSGALYYMRAISQSETVARNLARQLHTAAKNIGYLKLDIIAHSLGNRLVLEMMSALSEMLEEEPAPIIFGQLALMAAAVPVHYLNKDGKLFSAANIFSSTLNLYSEADRVLHFAFPLGQTAAGGGFFPVALGRKKWTAALWNIPTMKQQENPGADHGDYWGGEEVNEDTKLEAAKRVRKFMPHIGRLTSRDLETSISAIRKIPGRETLAARMVSVRTINVRR